LRLFSRLLDRQAVGIAFDNRVDLQSLLAQNRRGSSSSFELGARAGKHGEKEAISTRKVGSRLAMGSSLYSEDLEAFAAFRAWAEITFIRPGLTVAEWISGKEAAAP
jgi:hypothetical protein